MKKTASIIASVLLIAILASALTINVFANYQQTSFSTSVYIGTWSFISPAREKSNTSDMMIEIQSAPASTYRVRAMGCNDNASNLVNATVYGSSTVDYVVVSRYSMYRVQSTALQKGEGYATFGLFGTTIPGTVSGYWAPDILSSDETDYILATP